MPFLAACPFCRRKIQAPDTALGQSIACKKCHNYFTLAPEDDLPPPEATARTAQEYLIAAKVNALAPPAGEPAAVPAAKAPAPAPAKPVAAQVDTLQHVAMKTMPEMPRLMPALLPAPQDDTEDSAELNPLLVVPLAVGVIALLFAAMAWLPWLTIPLAAVGILAGVVTWLTTPIDSHRDGALVFLGSAASAVAFVWALM